MCGWGWVGGAAGAGEGGVWVVVVAAYQHRRLVLAASQGNLPTPAQRAYGRAAQAGRGTHLHAAGRPARSTMPIKLWLTAYAPTGVRRRASTLGSRQAGQAASPRVAGNRWLGGFASCSKSLAQ